MYYLFPYFLEFLKKTFVVRIIINVGQGSKFCILKPQKFWWLGCHRACVTAKPHNYYIRPKYLEIPTKHWQVIWSNEVLHAILDQRLFVHITHQRDILTWRVTTHLRGDNRMTKGHGKLIYVCLSHPINDYTQIVS